jgi:hypothetical protein
MTDDGLIKAVRNWRTDYLLKKRGMLLLDGFKGRLTQEVKD